MTWVTRARVMPSRRAISALDDTSPESSRSRHARAFRRRPTIRGARRARRFSRGALRTGAVVTTRSTATRRVSAPMLAVSNAFLGPRAISTLWSRNLATGGARRSSATCRIRNQTSGSAG